MTTVSEINDPAELGALKPLWDELLECTPGATFFQSLAWLQVYWKHFGARKRLRVLVVQDRNQIIGILPLVVRPVRRLLPVLALSYPLDGWGIYYGPIGPDPLATLSAGLDHIRRTPRDWHFIELAWVDALVDAGRTNSALDSADFHATCETQNAVAIIDLAEHGSWEAYFATRSSNHRNDLRRQEKKLARRGAVTFVRHRPSATEGTQVDPRWDLYDACEGIAQASWQGNARKGTMLNKETYREFYRDCHLAAACSGAVDLSLLLVDGEPAAFNYGCQYRGYVSAMKTAYDPAFAREGVGTVVRARTIADSFARGDHTFDIGSQFLDSKRQWQTRTRPIYRYLHFPPRAVGAQLVRGKRAIERRLRAAKRAIERPLRATVRRYRPISTSGR